MRGAVIAADAESARARAAIEARLFGGMFEGAGETNDAEAGSASGPRSTGAPGSSSSGPSAGDEGAGALAGGSVDRYELRGRLGAGGMGVVYRAYDPQLDRQVAVKLLRPDGPAGENDSRARSRLIREARAMAKLAHPNVIHVYDFGTHESSGQVYVVMELVDGLNLARWLEQNRLMSLDGADARALEDGVSSWRRVLDVFIAAGRGLVAAHDAGLVHRDFKPENVLVGRDGRVRVLDFGLARAPAGSSDSSSGASGEPAPARVRDSDAESRATAPSDPGDPGDPAGPIDVDGETMVSNTGPGVGHVLGDLTSLTRTGALVGTPRYMASEQIRGRPTDARTDQFSFCVALYEGLYAQRAFAGDGIHRYFDNVLDERVLEPRASDVPDWLWPIVRRGLSSAPDRRHPDMRALLQALEDGLARAPASPVASASPVKPAASWRFAAVAGLLIVVGVGGWVASRSSRAVEPAAAAELGRQSPVLEDKSNTPATTGAASETSAGASRPLTPAPASDLPGEDAADAAGAESSDEAEEREEVVKKPRRTGWCSMHEDNLMLLHRGRRRLERVKDRRGRCFECRVERDKSRVRRFKPSDCAHYQVCHPVAAEVCR